MSLVSEVPAIRGTADHWRLGPAAQRRDGSRAIGSVGTEVPQIRCTRSRRIDSAPATVLQSDKERASMGANDREYQAATVPRCMGAEAPQTPQTPRSAD